MQGLVKSRAGSQIVRLLSTKVTDTLPQSLRTPEGFVGSVGSYQQHLVIATGHHNWPKSITEDPFVAQIVGSVSRVPDVKFNCADNSIGEAVSEEKRDIFLYPQMIQLKGVIPDNGKAVANFVKAARDSPLTAILSSPLEADILKNQTHIIVCTHGAVDQRCGKCGQDLFGRLQTEIDRKGLSGKVKVQRSTHVGGHAFAANAIVYPSGDWYGLLTENDVPALLDHLNNNTVYWSKWRGRAGLSKEDQIGLFTTSTAQEDDSTGISCRKTINITIVLEDGKEKVLEVPLGKSLLEVCKDNNIPTVEGMWSIQRMRILKVRFTGVCGGHLECATCHMARYR
ncbi:Sucrase/ferredoxin-like-domain-containing protein [Chytridium lagenaria]|nr:Sucrase/ferredoxin-like-domain-containing protein [Chytridium lagenaria]